jgi:DNA-binding CsgD family transcriptional regulator
VKVSTLATGYYLRRATLRTTFSTAVTVLPGSTVTVGREEELARLEDGLVAARGSGGGRLLVITGEAGIGKSKLLAEAGRRGASRGMVVLSGRAVEGSGAFRPVVDALAPAAPAALAGEERLAPYRGVLARLLPSWSAGPPAPLALTDPIVLLGEAVIELLEFSAGGHGIVLMLDDLHWADRDTLALLGYLAGRASRTGILVVGTARDDEPAQDAVRTLVRHPAVTELALARLGDEEVVELARQRCGVELPSALVKLVLEASDGLPLLVEELVAAVVTSTGGGRPVPRTVAELTERRLADLPEAARVVVYMSAVLGGGIEWELLPLAGGWSDGEVAGALRAAVDAHLLVLDPDVIGGLRWRHALTRDAVLGRLLPPERAALAHRAAAALDSGGALAGDRVELAIELHVLAGAGSDAARLLLALARRAADTGALRSAEDDLRRAVRLTGGDDGDLSAELTVELVRVLALAGRADDAAELGEGLIDRVDGGRRVALCLHMARAAVAAERFADAGRYLEPIAKAGDSRVDALRAHVALGCGDLPGALRIAAGAIDVGERQDQPAAVCEALEIVGRCLRRSAPAASEEAFARAETLARQNALIPWRIRALSELGAQDLLRGGRNDRLEAARRLAVDAGMLVTSTILDVQLSACALLRDGPVAALPWALRAAEQADRLGLPGAGAAARYFIARGRLFGGEPFEAQLAEALALAPDTPDTGWFVDGLRGLAAWLDRDVVAAITAFDRAAARRPGSELASASPLWGMWALLRTLANPGDATREELRRARVLVQVTNAAAMRYCDAVAAARAGDQAKAGRLFTSGDDELGGYSFWRHLLHMVMAERAAAEGFGTPEPWLRGALAFLERTDEARLIRLCRALMRESGIAVPRAGRAGAAVPRAFRELGVTPREMEVLQLARRGLTNSEIAAQLYVSIRTVETHVAHLLTKTGVESRRRLAASPLSPADPDM